MRTLTSWLRRSTVSVLLVMTALLAGIVTTGVVKAAPANASTPPASSAGAGTSVPVPDWSAHLFVTPNGRYLWALSGAAGTVTVIDPTTDTVVGTVTGLWGDDYLAFDPSGRYAYVPNTGTGTVSQVDVATRKTVKQLPLGNPFDELGERVVKSTPRGDQLWVTAGNRNFVYVLDVAGGAKRKVVVADQIITATLAGNLLVTTDADDSQVHIVDTATDKVQLLHNP